MQSMTLKLNNLLESLEKEDYDKAVSYIEFLIDTRKKEKINKEKSAKDKQDVETIVASLTGAIPDTGKTLEEYRNERLKSMKFLIDTNVILGVLLKREDFYNTSAAVLNLFKQDHINFYISASAITDIYYIANQTLRNKISVKNLLLELF